MTRLSTLLSIAVLSALPALCAAEAATSTGPTYRIVSPDGHVTYSDRQPTDARLQTRELGHVAPTAPLFTPGSQLLEPPRVAPSPAGRFADSLTPVASANGRPFPPGVPDAVLSVVGHQFYVQTLAEVCSRAGTPAAERYQAIVLNWRDRNAALLLRSNRVMFKLFTGEQRDLLRATARSRLQSLLAPPDATAAERAGWCDRAADDLLRRRMELVGDERFALLLGVAVD